VASLDLQLLRTLVTVAEVSSITRAAKLLGLTQSTASLQLQRLEERLEVTLLSRSQRGVVPTAAGEAFLVYARRMLALEDEAVRSVTGRGGGHVRVGLTDVDATRYLPSVLRRFAAAYPEVQPQIICDVSTALVERFERGELDVCLSIQHSPASSGAVLGADPIVWVAGPELALDPAAPVPLALYPEYCIFRAHGLRALAGAGRRYEIVYVSQSTAAIDVAINQGWAVAIRSPRAVEPGWRVLGEDDGLPPLEPVEVELRRTPARNAPWIDALADLFAGAVGPELH
jgi:DNA-binding transcriptional LysR family regulator